MPTYYYPVKTETGFKLAITHKSLKGLGFAAFPTIRVAIASGERWYGGKFEGFDKKFKGFKK